MRALFVAATALAALACRPGAQATGQPALAITGTAGSAVVPSDKPPEPVAALLAEIDPKRLEATVATLAGFGTRHTLSATDSKTRGIGAAREWIAQQMRGYGQRLEVSFDTHRVAPDGRRITRDVDVVNVVAVLPGTMAQATGRRYYVIGHYDSRASDPMQPDVDAPGANDDASGVALVMELCRVAAARKFDATLVFMATAGEEQGLVGADRHARAAQDAGVDVRAVLSNDIVGDPTAPSGAVHKDRVRVFSEGVRDWLSDAELNKLRQLGAASDSPSRQLARYIATVAAWHALPVQPMLVFRRDRFLRGGDHTAFNRAGFAGVRFTEVEENYDRQHQDPRTEGDREFGDVPKNVDAEYLAGVARLNAAALVHLANAPASPANVRVIAAELTNDTTVRWDANPEPDVAGYEVVWRDTTAPRWQRVVDAGTKTEATLPQSKDNAFFGVRAYDAEGYRSPVTFADVGRK